jgi:hypothetical protein
MIKNFIVKGDTLFMDDPRDNLNEFVYKPFLLHCSFFRWEKGGKVKSSFTMIERVAFQGCTFYFMKKTNNHRKNFCSRTNGD